MDYTASQSAVKISGLMKHVSCSASYNYERSIYKYHKENAGI